MKWFKRKPAKPRCCNWTYMDESMLFSGGSDAWYRSLGDRRVSDRVNAGMWALEYMPDGAVTPAIWRDEYSPLP